MQLTGGKKPPVGILYDSDFGARIDTILALAMLHGLETKQEARIASVTISNPDLAAAQLCDVIEKFYLVPNPIIGLSTAPGPERELCRVVLKKLEVKPGIRSVTDTAPPEVMLRNALMAQYDGNAAMICCGPSINLQRLMQMRGARDLIQAKVRKLIVTGPAPAGWPTPVVAVSGTFWEGVPFPGASIEQDFSYVPQHPVAVAYRSYGAMPYDAPSTAMAAVLSGLSAHEESLDRDAIKARYTQLVSAKPQSRFRRLVQVDENKVAQ